ncbi:MAG: DUF3486 family protein [Azoarcus sp.]|jgi:hypothetical protein|nr:DUF3486 family protein [Azoarcus sp.]
MGRKGFTARTPAEIRAHIERRFGEGTITLDELRRELLALFPDEAVPSRSALGRYGQKLSRRLDAIKASTEAARLIHENAGDDLDARSAALTALVQTELFDAIMHLQEADGPDLDPVERIGKLSTAAKNIAPLIRSSLSLKKWQAEVRTKLEALEKAAKKPGATLDAETLKAVKETLYG